MKSAHWERLSVKIISLAVLLGSLPVQGFAVSQGYNTVHDAFLGEAVSPPLSSSHQYLGLFNTLKNTVILLFLATAALRAEPTNQLNRTVRPLGFTDQLMMQRDNPQMLHKILLEFGYKNRLPIQTSDNNETLVQKMLSVPAPINIKVDLVYCVRLFRVPDRITESLLSDRNPQIRLAMANTLQYLHDPKFIPTIQNRLQNETSNLVLCSLAISAINIQGRAFVDRTILDSIGEKPSNLSKQHAADILMLLQDTKYDEMVIKELLKQKNRSNLVAQQLDRMDQDKVNRIKADQRRQSIKWLWFLLPIAVPFAYGLKRLRQSSLKEAA